MRRTTVKFQENSVKIFKFAAMVLAAVLLLPGLASAAPQAGNAIARLQAFLRDVHSLKADFTQVEIGRAHV